MVYYYNMSEKRGNTVKLQYDFNSARCCEIEYSPGKWVRTTPREFRSFGGNRRILNVDNALDVFYEEYNGPVYLFGTNQVVKDYSRDKVQFKDGIDPREAYRKQGKWRT